MMSERLHVYASDPASFQADLVIPSAHGPERFGDCMAPFQRERFASINPALIAVARGEKPPIGRHWWEATKGASKDSDLAVCLVWLLAFSRRPLFGQVGAADQDQADELRKAAKDVLRLNPWLAQQIEIQNWRILCNRTQAICEIVPADVAGSHGARPDVLILNELSHVTKEEFASNMMDNAAKVPNGLGVVATNAGFLDTWQYRWRELGRTSPRWSFQQYARPSPWLDPAEVAEAETRNTPSRFRRLFWGAWASGAGDAIEESDLQESITQRGPMNGTEARFSFVAGLDLATRSDHAALVVLGADSSTQRVRVASVQSWKPQAGRVPLESVRMAVLRAHRQFRLLSVHFDPYQAVLMAEQLSSAGIRMVEMPFVGANLVRMATSMLNAFRNRQIDLYNHPELLSDLRKLKIIEKAFGYKLEAAADVTGHADRAFALAIALPAAIELCTAGFTGRIEIAPAMSLPLPPTGHRGVQLDGRQRMGRSRLPCFDRAGGPPPI